jgi:hypothetical protein
MRPAQNGISHASNIADAVFLTPNEGQSLIVGMYKAGTFHRTPILKGSPGCGKTTAVRAAAKELRQLYPDFGYEEINPTMPADEVGGIPDLIRVQGQVTTTDYALPKWFPRDPNSRGIICLDDALQGDRMMQNVLANFILGRNLRGHMLPDGWMIVATGNRMEDKAGVTKTLSHLADRMCHINIAIEPKAWVDDYALPKGVDEKIVAYIMMDGSKLDMFDPNAEKCATARTWSAVNGHLKYLDTLSDPKLIHVRNKFAQSVLSGELGMGQATEFWAFCDLFGQLPDLDKVLADPDNAPLPAKIDVRYALAIALAKKLDDTTFANGLKYIDRIGQDLTTVVAKLAVKREPKLMKSPAWMKWTVQNQDVVCAV